MKKPLLILVLAILTGVALGQELHREIDWIKSATGGLYVNDQGVPLYQEAVVLQKGTERLKLVNPVFEPVEKELEVAGSLSSVIEVSPRYVQGQDGFQAIVEFVPLVEKDGLQQRLKSFDWEVTSSYQKNVQAAVGESWKNSSVLASGKWVKIKTKENGVHKISYSQLQSWGFSDPAKVSIYGNGGYMLPKMNDTFYFDDLEQNAIMHGQDGAGNSCIFFYATGTVDWELNEATGDFTPLRNDYADAAYYFLTDQGSVKTVPSAEAVTGTPTYETTSYSERGFYEQELENLIHSGRRWFGEKFLNNQSRSVSIPLNSLATGSPLRVSVVGAARSSSTSKMAVRFNNSSAGNIDFAAVNTSDAIGLYASLNEGDFEVIGVTGTLDVNLSYQASNSNARAWLDYITINYRSKIDVGNQLLFRDVKGVGAGNISRYTLSTSGTNLTIWDITNHVSPKDISFSGSGSVVVFNDHSDELKEYVAFKTTGSLPEVELVGDVNNQNLHQLSGVDMVIISHPDFLTQANELAQFHLENDQLTTKVLTPAVIYNEFSGGAPDVAGIRNFLKCLYDQPGSSLKYVLLFGDGSYDNKNITGNATNFILTYQSPNSLVPTSSFVTDDFFVLLDAGEGEYTGLIDLGIGRIPANTVEEAQIAVDKIKSYALPEALGDWRNTICFIGDDEDVNTHMRQADALADMVNEKNPSFYTDKIYFDAYEEKSTTGGERYPGVTEAINNRVKEGVLILNYIGHANETALAHEKVLGPSEIDNWSNTNKLPIFVTATCEISRFDADESSGGEHILFNPNGGGIGLFSTTRVVYSTPNFILSKSFYENVFEQDEQGNNLRMGDILKRAKNGVNTGINKRNFTLLADPALRLAFPQYHVETETINGQPAESLTDTIGALSVVKVAGNVSTNAGQVLSDFDGELIAVVYDKKYEVETLGNGGEDPFQFDVQNNVIYKGVTTVTNGEFEFTFIVPKDISYAIGQGKISYYANDGTVDAHGVFQDFKIGGSSGSVVDDRQGPSVNLYMDRPDFQSGDEVGKNALLIADVEDASGINTIGVGIGHDITAVLDDDYTNILILNDYYLSDKDSYTKGQILYPMSGLTAGEHRLKLKVWDVVNNSTEVEIRFVVNESLEISEVEAYPNPATERTEIIFYHNRPDESFDTKIEVFNIAGSLIEVINKRVGSTGGQSLPLVWQINESQALIRSGAYLYRVMITSEDGYEASKTGKIIISKY